MTSTANSQMLQKRERQSTNKTNVKGEEVKGVCVLYYSCDFCVGPKYFKIKKKMGITSMVSRISHLFSVLGLIKDLCIGEGVCLGC